MKTTRKITGLFLALCMLLPIISVGIVPTAALTVTAGTATYETYAQDTIEGSNILHCFNWSYNNIKTALPDIAAAGYTAVQTSPVQSPKDYNSSWTDTVNQWWKLYQPLGFSVSDNTWLGTKAQLTSLCTEAEKYGIKVIVDIVANHVANNGSDGGGYSYVNSAVESQLQGAAYYHSSNTGVSDTNRNTITQYHLGMPDLNTANTTVQGRVISLMEECVNCGVDGFRFDAAKHIELPTDTSANCASDFWPNVLNTVSDYASDDLFYYGEILGSAGTNISNYTAYMAVTDNQTGDRALDKAFWQAASELADGIYYKGASAEKSVLWVESHDTYMGNSGSAWVSNTKDIDKKIINMAWAIVGARADSTALFFARPNSVMGAASLDTNWKSTEVAEVNKFKNHFEGTSEHLSSSDNIAYIERGTKGVVISKLDGLSGSVSLTAHQMANGTYKDQITGNTFTVSNGTISGTVGNTGIAVVYNASDDALSYISESTLYLKPNSNWNEASARFAMYVYNSATGADAWASMTSAGSGYYSADVPSGDWTNVIFVRMNPSGSENRWDAYEGEGHVWNQTNDLFPDVNTNCYTIASGAWSNGDGSWSLYSASPTTAPTSAPTAAPTAAPTTAPSSNTKTIYAINNANWSKVAIHYWGDGETDWPGTDMTSIAGTKVYSFNVPKDVSGIVFTNGASGSTKQTGNITSGITDGATWTIGSASSNNYPCSVAPDYYLVGTMNSWSNNNNYKFSINANTDGKLEYKLSGVQLAANAEFKVHSSSDSWYPGGSNHTVSSAGVYDIYFRPNGDGVSSTWLSDSSNSSKRYVRVVDVTPCTITWKDGDGNTLKTEQVKKGDTPEYSGTTPTKTATAQYTYTFNNTWSPAVAAVTADVTYTAQFNQSTRTYTVTWKNYEGTVLETDTAEYGSIPSYDGATPTRPNDGTTTYVFSGWSPQITSETRVTGDVTYIARFSTNTRAYTIRWYDGDDNLLKTETCIEGVTPQYIGTTPTKTATAQYTYTFNGTWTNAAGTSGVVAAQKNETYTANFDATVNKYDVTWKDGNGDTLKTEQVEYGTTPSYSGTTPTKNADADYTYTFNNTWTPAITPVTQAATYTAQFNATPIPVWTVYATNVVDWSNVYLYYWTDFGDNSWPGVKMTPDDDNFIWSAQIPANAKGIVFTDGAQSDAKQTVNVTSGIADGAHWAILNEKDTDETSKYKVHAVPTYYLVGSMTNWQTGTASTFTPHKASTKVEEYKLAAVDLSAGDQIKVYGSDDTWHPGGSGSNYTVSANGTYDVYFRPNADGGSTWHENVFYLKNVTPYTITWVDGNGETLKTDTVTHGDTPAYIGDTPTKTATAQYTYTFNNTWSPSITAATADKTYTAQFDSTVNKYTVTWKNYNGTTLETDENVAYGTTPSYDGATPTKPADDSNHYAFTGWSPAVSSVTGNVTYTAQFSSTLNTYTITWKDGDGETLKTDTVTHGDTPAYEGDTPTKTATDQYTYTFNNTWSPAITAATADATYTAQFDSTVNKYEITWKDGNGETLKTEEVAYGTTPAYEGDTPTKTATAQYTYTFNNTWSPAITSVTKAATYTAQFDSTVNKYTVTWKNYDGEVLETDENVEYGTMPGYNGATPTKPSDLTNTYTFSGWSPNASAVTGNVTYTAQFTPHPVGNISITVTNAIGWDNVNVYYWAGSANNGWPGTAMTAADENNFTFTASIPATAVGIVFTDGAAIDPQQTANIETGIADGAHWVICKVNNQVTVKPVPTYYLVGSMTNWQTDTASTFTAIKNADGLEEYKLTANLSNTDQIKVYGSNDSWYPSGEGNNYTVTADGTYEIWFRPNYDGSSGWHENVFYVKNITEYTITWKDGNGETLKTDTVIYGETPAYEGDTPTKTATAQYTYTFNNTWSPTITAATKNETYTAQFDSTVNEYTIEFVNDDGTVLQSSDVAYGETPQYTGATPTKASDGQYSYTFDTWSPAIVTVTQAATYTATYTEELLPLFAGHTLTLKGGIGENFYLNLTDEQAAKTTVAFSWDDHILESVGVEYDEFYGLYKATCSLFAADMTYEVTATVTIDGEVQQETNTYSVESYARVILEDEDFIAAYKQEEGEEKYNQLAALVKSMLNYGAAAQVYFERNTDALANRSLSAEDQTVAAVTYQEIDKPYDSGNTNLPDGVAFKSVTLSLRSETTLSLYFKSSDTLSFSCNAEGVTVERDELDNCQVARIRGIKAKDLGNDFTVTVTAGENSGSVTYCPMTYCYNIIKNGTTEENLPEVVTALYWYWQKAVIFFTNN